MSDGVDLEMVKKTQQTLGKYVKKPQLSEKLLSKPPFRFLHDVVVAVIKNTGFLKDLFKQEELIADNVKEREAKLAFLNKLIDAVKNITNIDLKVRATKIIAGAQPNETNLLLQAIAHGINKKLDSSEYVKQLTSSRTDQLKIKRSSSKELKSKSPKDEKSPTERKNKENRSKSRVREVSKDRKLHSKEDKGKKEKKTPVSSSRSDKTDSKLEKNAKKSKEVKNLESPESISKTYENSTIMEKYNEDVENKSVPILEEPSNDLESFTDQAPTNQGISSEIVDDRPRTRDISSGFLSKMLSNKTEEKDEEQNEKNTETVVVPSVENEKNLATAPIRQMSARPKSARPKSGELKEKIERHSEHQKMSENNENIVLQTSSIQRPKSSLRPPSVRPSSARPGAPRLRPDSALPIQEVVPMGKINVIVENFDNDAEEDESVVIHNTAEETTTAEPIADLPAKNQSHLVEQILDQIQENKDVPNKIESDWEQDNLGGRDTTSKEMNHLRNLIQTFTKSTNPLGKLLNYLHEDIETMHAERQQWSRIKSQLFTEIAKQEKLKIEMEKPLLEKLENLKQEIAKQEQEIVDVRAVIFKNDLKLRELINK